MKKLLSIDWITLNLKGSVSPRYSITYKERPYGSKQFARLYDVTYESVKIGCLSTLPYLPSLPHDYCQLKLDNSLLYRKDFFRLVNIALMKMGFDIVDISRIDLSLDFNCFQNGLSCEDFIARFAANKYYTMSKCKFMLMGEKSDRNRYQYLSLGSKQSAVKTILYNKSKEMSEVKFKPYIFDAWEKVGIDTKRDVWRLEFSLKHDAMSFGEKETGQTYTVTWKDIQSDDFLLKMYQILFSRYFRFIHATTKTNHYREPMIQLIDFEYVKTFRHRIITSECTTRSDRIYAARLAKEVSKVKVSNFYNAMDVKLYASEWLMNHRLTGYIGRRGLALC